MNHNTMVCCRLQDTFRVGNDVPPNQVHISASRVSKPARSKDSCFLGRPFINLFHHGKGQVVTMFKNFMDINLCGLKLFPIINISAM